MTDERKPLMQMSEFGFDFEEEPEVGSVVVTRSGEHGQWVDGWRRTTRGWHGADDSRVTYSWKHITDVATVVAIVRPGRRDGS